MKKVIIGFSLVVLVALCMWAVGGSMFTDVASHSAPKMVSEMNTALDALEDRIDGTANMGASGRTWTATNSEASLERVWLRMDGGNSTTATTSNNVYSTWYLFRQYNDAGGSATTTVDIAHIRTTATDVTGGTEDGQFDVYTKVNGTDTLGLRVVGVAGTVYGLMTAGAFSTTGAVTIAEGALTDDKVVEADLKAVDSATDEDFLTYESTTGDFEWHSIADISAGIAADISEGELKDSIVVSADIKDGEISEADLKCVDAPADEAFLTYEATTGDFEWHTAGDVAGSIAAAITEGQLANSVVVSADIKDGEIANADISASAAIASSKLAQDVCRIGDTSNTNQLFQSGNVTMHTGTIWTQTFDTAYADTPIVVANYTEDPGDVQPLYVTSATTVNFTLTVTADKNFNWISLGRKQ